MTGPFVYFAGDVHLLPEPLPHPGRERFLSFLAGLLSEEPGELWITGDLFDFWFEYGSAIPSGYERLFPAMSALGRAGWRTVFLPGNHDWWVGRHFERASGFRIDRTPVVETVCSGIRTAVAHGDGLGGGDFGYRYLLRPVLRAGISEFLFGLLHPDLGAVLGRLASGTSRRVLRREITEIPEGMTEWAGGMISEGFGAVVTGHIHASGIRRIGTGVHVSTGDWVTTFTCARFGPDGPVMLEFPAPGSR